MYAVYMYGLVLLVVIEMYHVGLPAALESIRTTSAFTVPCGLEIARQS